MPTELHRMETVTPKMIKHYYKPGVIVWLDMSSHFDKVLKFETSIDEPWRVTVQACDIQGKPLEGPNGIAPIRSHYTVPCFADFKGTLARIRGRRI